MPVLKGAFLRFDNDLLGALPVVVVFQFNPESLSRTPSQPKMEPDNPATQVDARRVNGEAAESMSFDLQIDATDQLAASSPLAAASGILPTLSALELLMVPKASLNLSLLSGVNSHASPPREVPLVLFFWGPYRIVPVRITKLTIDESRFDTRLNPVRAKVSVTLDVLTPNLLRRDEKFAQGAYKYTQGVKEVMAALNLLNAVDITAGAALSLLV